MIFELLCIFPGWCPKCGSSRVRLIVTSRWAFSGVVSEYRNWATLFCHPCGRRWNQGLALWSFPQVPGYVKLRAMPWPIKSVILRRNDCMLESGFYGTVGGSGVLVQGKRDKRTIYIHFEREREGGCPDCRNVKVAGERLVWDCAYCGGGSVPLHRIEDSPILSGRKTDA